MTQKKILHVLESTELLKTLEILTTWKLRACSENIFVCLDINRNYIILFNKSYVELHWSLIVQKFNCI